ncbi:acetolactate synthase small subunit [Inconstantimicrobium mannanitabidum]|uniref:Acetolactate synthase small subunit n=1 Tax=Inconstantimicrobium mannanitabidum TaxID=1604901 RepID=A0ACB5REK4_9CLOT|nr:acetolactate synthase small subunit [Clostridium sp. TW13]GKX67713.1 acetolactate synthase small subunit [Clostridium sp. TW13]
MNTRVLSIIVSNYSGVLCRISSLFARRGYNIDSLSVGSTENPKFSRMTITVKADDDTVEQMIKQINKLEDVKRVVELNSSNSVVRELVLIKVAATEKTRAEINEIVNIFRCRIVDLSHESLTVLATGGESKISAIIDLMNKYGIQEMVRTGISALGRGEDSVHKDLGVEDYEE